MKILFLDIDGVLNSEQTHRKDPAQYFPIDPYMAFLVGKIQLDTDCVIVLSSSWRHSDEGVAEIEKRVGKVFGKTPDLRSPAIRGDEIKAWMDEWGKGCFPNPPQQTESGLVYNIPIKTYAILDDDDDMCPEQFGNFFKTSWKEGLTKDIADKIITHLNRLDKKLDDGLSKPEK